MKSRQQVYVSEYLKNTNRGALVFERLSEILGDRLKEIHGNKNEWCRDYMPIRGANGKLVQFRYQPSYVVGKTTYEKTVPTNLPASLKELGIQIDEESEIILDGGAIDIHGDIAIITDRVISENSSEWKNGKPVILDEIKRILGLEKLIVIPTDPWDITGHADGTVRIVNENRVLVNYLSDMLVKGKSKWTSLEYDTFTRWIEHLDRTLVNAGFKIERMPCSFEPNGSSWSAWGVYLNFLLLDDILIMPWFEGEKKNNERVQSELSQLYNRPVHGVYADQLSEWGGIVNCVTWQQNL